MEAVGIGPASEVALETRVTMLSRDVHTGTVAPLQRDATGVPVYTYERWLRLRFTNDVVYATAIRFWIDNLSPSPGWSLRMGVSATYQQPVNSRSALAYQAIPISDPGEDSPNLSSVMVHQYSPWLVLQASWSADDDDPFQLDPLDLNFAWSESQ